jgi:hypothetical protein
MRVLNDVLQIDCMYAASVAFATPCKDAVSEKQSHQCTADIYPESWKRWIINCVGLGVNMNSRVVQMIVIYLGANRSIRRI